MTFVPPTWRGLLGRLPTQCMLCRAWQGQMLCTPCLSHWQPPATRCTRCAIGLARAGTATCQACEDASPEFDRAIAALDYTAPWSALLARFKFQGATALAGPLGDLLAQAAAARRGRVSLVLPVPLSPQRLAERGYNQSWLLARHVAQRLSLSCRHDLLTRTRHTARLMSMSAEERAREIRDVFEVTPLGREMLRGRHVAVVDDVMTTGATLNAAARALLDGGARSVSAWVVARTPAPDADDAAPDAAPHAMLSADDRG